MAEQRILLGSTQSLVSYPRVAPGGAFLRGVPSSATVRIGTVADSMPSVGVSATVDSVSTTATQAALEGATSITVASMTAVLGRRYLVQPATGSAYVEVVSATAGVLSASALTLAEPLPLAVASGAAVKGWAVTKALTAAQTAEPGSGLAIFKATVDGVDYEWSHEFRIVRRIPTSVLTPTRLTQAWPSVRQMRSRQDVDFEETIEAAWGHRILPFLAANGIDAEDVTSVDVLEPLHAVGCVLQLVEGNPAVPRELVESIQRRWERLSETTLARKDWWETPQDSQPTRRPEEKPAARSGLTLTR